MEILETKVMRGPNYWSCYRKMLIQMKVDIGHYENRPTDAIEGFADRLQSLMPSLYDHRCSEGVTGGFLQRVRAGTWLGHVMEHVALELQALAGMNCGYGRTRSTSKKGVYHVVFAYEIEEAGVYAGHAALKMVEALATGTHYSIQEDINFLKRIKAEKGLGPSSQAIYQSAVNRKIPVRRLNNDSDMLLGFGHKLRKVCAALTDTTSAVAVELVQDKAKTKALLESAGIPVPAGIPVSIEHDLEKAIDQVGFPLVIKPLAGNHGRGVVADIQNKEDALSAFNNALLISDEVIVEQFVRGNDYRLLLVDYKLVACAQRIAAFVKGDGHSTIRQLVDELNNDPARGNGHENFLTAISIDQSTGRLLQKNGYSFDSVPDKDVCVTLKDTANISTGGRSRDVTDDVHPEIRLMAERVARLTGLDICGIDVIAQNIHQPAKDSKPFVIEVNASPGLRMHLRPSEGQQRDVATPILQMLFGDDDGRIPIVAVTGTNGKTTVTRLVAHFATIAGFNTGFTATEGIYINNRRIVEGDCSGPSSARAVLSDPQIEFAVLECARGGILRSGLGFDHCSTSIITNITEDHLGLDEISSLRQLKEVKSVVARSTLAGGVAVLNADDELVYQVHDELDCRVALFSMRHDNERLLRHCRAGGLVATVEGDFFVVRRGHVQTKIARVAETPLTLEGRADCMIQNILAAVLAAIAENIPLASIREGLATFLPVPEQAPGRLNIFRFNDFEIILDYAHNTAGMEMLRTFLSKTTASFKTGIVASAGDRRDEDIIAMGKTAAMMFDDIIIRHDKDGRGRDNDQLTWLIQKGISQVNDAASVTVISDERDAIRYAVEHASPGAVIVCCTDDVHDSIEFIRELQSAQSTIYRKIMEQNY
jgi:cyanophycin synthetase